MTPLAIPVFIRPKAPAKRGRKPSMPVRVVAALRWDYEIGLESMAVLSKKYSGVMHPRTAQLIMNRDTYPDVQPVRNTLAWRPK